MKILIVGVKDTKFANRDTGEVVEGQTLYFEYEALNTRGMQTDKCFLPVSRKLVPEPSVPCSASLYYNKYGKVDSIILD